jgi:hypothetical protein
VSRELRSLQISFTTNKSEHLPKKDGEQMYADDVDQELREAMATALDSWYRERGHELLACEPYVL